MAEAIIKLKVQVQDIDKVKTALKGLGTEIVKTGETAKKSSNGIAAGFLKAELAMKAMRAAFKLAGDSMKEFSTRTGDKTLEKFNQNLKNVQLQIGSGLTKELSGFTKFFEQNSEQILKIAGNIVEGFLGLKDIIVGVFLILPNAVLGFGEIVVLGFSRIFEFIVGGFSKLVNLLPPQIVPTAWKVGIAEFADSMSESSKIIEDEANATAQTVIDGQNMIVNGSKRIGDAFKGNVAVVHALTVKELEKQQKEEEDRKARAKKQAEDEANLLKRIQLEISKNKLDIISKQIEDEKNLYGKRVTKNMAPLIGGPGQGSQTAANILAQEDANIRIKKLLDERYAMAKKEIQDEYAFTMLHNNLPEIIEDAYILRNQKLNMLNAQRIEDDKKTEEDLTTIFKDAMQQRKLALDKMSSVGNEDKIKRVKTEADEEINIFKELLDKKIISIDEFNSFVIAKQEETNQIISDLHDEQYSSVVEKVSKVFNEVLMIQSAAFSSITAYNDLQNMLIDKEVDKRKSAAKSNIRNKKELEKELAKIDEDADKKRRKLQKSAYAMQIAMAIGTGAQATINAFATQPVWLGIAMGIIVAALSTVQVGIMLAQYAKMAVGGIVPGDPSAGDSVPTMLQPGEMVSNRKQQQNLLMAIANGQRQTQAIPTVSIGDTSITINGDADKAMVERALRENRQRQMSDMKSLLRDMQYAGQLKLQVA